MPEEQIVPANGNPGAEADPSPASDTQLDQSSSSSVKPRRSNFDWKSAFGSSGGYTSSKRVISVPEPKIVPEPSPELAPPEVPPESEATAVTTAAPTAELEQPPVAQIEEPAVESADVSAEVSTEPEMTLASPQALVEETEPPLEEVQTTAALSPELVKDVGVESGGTVTGTTPLIVRVCPYLGLRTDRSSHFVEVSPAHFCYSPAAPGGVSVDYQKDFCFTAQYPSCARFPKTEAAQLAAAAALPMATAELGASPVGVGSLGDTFPAPLPPAEVGRAGRSRVLDFLLWGLAIVLAAFAIYTALPILLRNASFTGQAPATATTVAVIAAPSPIAVPTNTPQPTSAPVPQPANTLSPLVIPTPSDKEVVFNLLPDTRITGWSGSNERLPHWGERNLYAGTLQNHAYTSVMVFSFNNLPADSKLSFAVLELTGIGSDHLGNTGEWKLELLEHRSSDDWLQATTNDVFGAPAVTTLGQPVTVSQLGVGKINRFEFDDAQRKAIEDQFKYGSVAFRLTGPKSDEDNLFTWDSGSTGQANAPAFHVVIQPGTYTVIVNTPTPANVLTAAAYIFRQTQIAKTVGTLTPFPPGVVTATPGGQVVLVPAETAVPGNQGTAAARSALATAIAITTGTYTPTSVREVVVFPTATPFLIDANHLATPTPRTPADFASVRRSQQYLALIGRIIAKSNFYTGKDGEPIVLNTDGQILGKLSSELYYRAALDREGYSPDFNKKVIYVIDDQGIQQIGILDLVEKSSTILTHFTKGVAYDAAWSNDGSALAFVSSESKGDDIYTYDFGSRSVLRVTNSEGLGFPFNKHPSWSPDGQNIAFWSSRNGHPQIWVVSRDGSNLMNLSNRDGADETDPVWVK
jgi:hypothetical protein